MLAILAGLCIGVTISSLLWNEKWDLKMFIRYHLAAWGIVAGCYLMIAASK